MPNGSYTHNYNPDMLRELIKQGHTAPEIMKKLKISKWSFREQLLLLQKQDKTYYDVKGLFEDPKKSPTVFKHEGVVFSQEMLEKTDFKPGDQFEMIVEKDRIILQKI